MGFLPASDPRVRGTIAAIEKHMMRDGFVLRHDPREVSDEQQPIEGAFLACSLWLADAYVLAGEIDKAQALFDRVVAVANDLGLLAEEYDSGAGRQTGNFPQALTHIALINTAHNLSDAQASRSRSRRCSGRNRQSWMPLFARRLAVVIAGGELASPKPHCLGNPVLEVGRMFRSSFIRDRFSGLAGFSGAGSRPGRGGDQQCGI